MFLDMIVIDDCFSFLFVTHSKSRGQTGGHSKFIQKEMKTEIQRSRVHLNLIWLLMFLTSKPEAMW